MQLTVFAFRYAEGVWKYYEHDCSEQEVDAIFDFAKARAFDNLRPNTPQYADFLAGARFVFNVAYVPLEGPAEGDLRVFAVKVDDMPVRLMTDFDDLLAQNHTEPQSAGNVISTSTQQLSSH